MSKRVVVWFGTLVLLCLAALGCSSKQGAESTSSTERAALTLVTLHDFEDGTLQGWIPRGGVTLTSTTEAAASGSRSLKTTGRTQGFHGPSLDALPILVRGATYEISLKARLVAGEAPTTLRLTMQQTAGGANQFVTVAQATNATDGAWVTMTGTFSYAADVSGLLLYVEATTATASFYIDDFSVTETIPPPGVSLLHDFEDGTLEGWTPRGPVTLTNDAEAASDGSRSLKTTGRTAGFHGPSLNLLGVLRKGATYQVSVSARLVAAEAPTTLRVTVQRTPTGASSAFDSVASANATDASFVTLTGLYSFGTDVTGLLLYVEAASATASFYIDSFSLVELSPPPGPPANTSGATATFEGATAEGWFSRTGVEALGVSTADARSGAGSLLTTGRTASFRGPAFDVTNVMFNGSRYRISVWAKLAPGEPDTQLRLSLERRLGSQPASFHTVVGNTPVTAGEWVRLSATYDLALANTGLTLYLESNGGAPLSSFYIDDFQLSFVPPPEAERDIPSLREHLAPFFPVGAAIHAGDLAGEHAFLLTKHFSSVTSENDMKWSALQPAEGSFDYAAADAQLAFARTNGLRFRGHTLVWHNQTPAWVFSDANGAPLTPTPENKALLLARLETHVRAVVQHFGPDVYAWDVVNEVIDPAQPDGFRRSPWFDIIGPEFIDRAFQVAREAAPAAELYINDYDTTNATKRQFLHDLVRDLRSRGVPVDGVGHQMHGNVDFPSAQALTETIELFAALGVKNELTELDVSVYSGSLPGPIADYGDIPAERLVLQGYRYRDFFGALKQLGSKVNGVTFWGQADDHTWLSTAGRADAPLLFDPSLRRKHAYFGIVEPGQLPGADLRASIVASGPSLPAGRTLTWTLGVENAADDDVAAYLPSDDDLPASNVAVASELPPYTVFESLDAPAGWSCTTPPVGGSGTLRCTRESLAVSASEVFTVTLRVASCSAPDGAVLTSSVTATSKTADPSLLPDNTATTSVLLANPAPVVTLNGPAAVTLECGTAFPDPGATASDACDGSVEVTVSGGVDTSRVGVSTVTYSALDSAGNAAPPAQRLVSVVDTTPPLMNAQDLTVLLPGVKVALNDGTLRVNGRSFALAGRPLRVLGHTVELAGEAVVVDGEAFPLDGRTVMLLLPLRQYQSFGIADFVAALGADCDPALDLGDVTIAEVTSDEPEDAPGGADGATSRDIDLGADCRSVRLRSERSNTGNGRVYTVTLHVRDASGNQTARALKVLVPRRQGSGPAIDNGPQYSVACP